MGQPTTRAGKAVLARCGIAAEFPSAVSLEDIAAVEAEAAADARKGLAAKISVEALALAFVRNHWFIDSVEARQEARKVIDLYHAALAQFPAMRETA